VSFFGFRINCMVENLKTYSSVNSVNNFKTLRLARGFKISEYKIARCLARSRSDLPG
jgi:hypothetical protein